MNYILSSHLTRVAFMAVFVVVAGLIAQLSHIEMYLVFAAMTLLFWFFILGPWQYRQGDGK